MKASDEGCMRQFGGKTSAIISHNFKTLTNISRIFTSKKQVYVEAIVLIIETTILQRRGS